jgi:hypothetical protein
MLSYLWLIGEEGITPMDDTVAELLRKVKKSLFTGRQ